MLFLHWVSRQHFFLTASYSIKIVRHLDPEEGVFIQFIHGLCPLLSLGSIEGGMSTPSGADTQLVHKMSDTHTGSFYMAYEHPIDPQSF